MSDINHFDTVFVVDTTGSMGSFIDAARRMMITMVKSLAQNSEVDLKIGIVEYRDHPPQDTVLTKVHQLCDIDTAQRRLAQLNLGGGGDAPEAVFDGIVTAVHKIDWRKHSRKVAVLVGDAPPHGVGCPGDGFPKGCPCGETVESVSSAAEQKGVTLYAVSLNPAAHKSFSQLAQLTGGDAFDSMAGHTAIDKIQHILKQEFGNLKLDRRVLDAWQARNDWGVEVVVDTLAEALKEKPSDVAASYMRLCCRGLIVQQAPEVVEV
jgi:Mg-chelatase subunit ChlD